MTSPQALVNDRKEIFGWAMYDWANSAFSTTVGTVFLGPYIASLAATTAESFPDGMARFFGIPVSGGDVPSGSLNFNSLEVAHKCHLLTARRIPHTNRSRAVTHIFEAARYHVRSGMERWQFSRR